MSDDLGCAWFFIGAAALGLWWGAQHYKIVEKNPSVPTPLPSIPALQPARPSGYIDAAALENGTIWKLDADNTKGPRKERLAWVLEDYSNVKTVRQRIARTLYRLDCETGHYVTLSSVYYDAKGKVLERWKEAELKSDGYAVPNSNMDGIVREACVSAFGP